MAVLIGVGALSLVSGAAQGDSQLITLGVLCLVVFAPFTWWFLGWQATLKARIEERRGARP